MKRLLIALAAAVAVSTASAIITDTQLFEFEDLDSSDWRDDFVADGDDESKLAAYESAPGITAPYPCDSFGSKYLSLDTGDATLWRTNTAVGNVYFDMALQFHPSATPPELEEDDPTKILLYQNTESNLVILAGTSSSDRTPKSYVTTTKVTPGTWARVTVSSSLGENGYSFTVRLKPEGAENAVVLKTAENVESFPSLTPDTTIEKVGFSGSGALDNFVARTTDPYYEGAFGAQIGTGDGCEKYFTYSEALADALIVDPVPAIKIYGEETPVDGSEGNPYQIPNAACLKALQDAVLANPAARSLHYVQTGNIDMTGVAGFYGIGWFKSSTAYLSLPEGVTLGSDGKTTDIPFAGVYDGAGYTISNVTLVRHNYAGVFNCVEGTVKNLTVQNLKVNDTVTGTNETATANGAIEWGCAIVGNAQGRALLENLTSAGTVWGTNANHNTAGIAARAEDNATITGCVNNVDIASTSKRLGGIVAFTGSTAAGDTVTIIDCINNGNLSSTDGSRGVGGILASPETGTGANTVIKGCANFGTLTAGSSGFTGWIVGSLGVSTASSYTDAGGNTFLATGNMLGTRGKNTRAIAGLAFALPTTISETDYLITVAQDDLATGNTYTLLADVAASETPVFTLAAAGDTIAFDTVGGYTFAGTVAASDPNMMDVSSTTEGTVTTYTAAAGTAVATITKSGDTTSYSTLQKAIAAAEPGDTVNLVGAATGAVNIPEGVTVAVAAGSSLSDVSSLAGSGVLYAASPEALQIVNAKSGLFSASDWEGVVSLANLDISAAIDLTRFGNANSVVRFNNAGCAFTTGSTTAHAIKALEIGPNGLDLIGNYSSGTFTFPCALTGTGNLKIAAKDSQYGTDLKVAKFTGDVSGFTGSINFDANAHCAVYFGDATGDGNCISVAAGKSVTVAAGKTWTAPAGFVVNGTLVVDGTLAPSTASIYGAGGTVTFTSSATILVGQYFTGTYNANFNSGNGNYAFDLPINAGATTVINGANGTFCGYPRFNNSAPTVAGSIVLNANWVSSNGYSLVTTTFAKLSGTGDLIVDGTDSQYTGNKTIPYAITELDNYTGTLGGRVGSYTIGKVNVAEQPENGARVVKTAVVNGAVNDNVPLYVAGVDTGKTLTYVADGAEGAGLYYVVSGGAPVIDPVTGKVSADTAEAAAAAGVAVSSDVAAALTTAGVSEETYQGYFTKSDPVLNTETGKYEVTATISETVESGVEESAIAALTTDATAVTVPAGLYYKITPSADLSTWGTVATGLSDGTAITVTKPSSTDKGFFKVELSAAPFTE